MTTAEAMGEGAGRFFGGWIGGIIGSLIPPPGVGTMIGRAVGSRVGGLAGRAAAATLQDHISSMEEAENEADETDEQIGATSDDEECLKCADDENKKEDGKDVHDNIEQYEGQDYDEVEKDLDQKLKDDGGWDKKPLKKGDGSRYTSPDGKRQVRINRGYPEGSFNGPGDGIHNGPYISRPSTGTRIPLKSNPGLARPHTYLGS